MRMRYNKIPNKKASMSMEVIVITVIVLVVAVVIIYAVINQANKSASEQNNLQDKSKTCAFVLGICRNSCGETEVVSNEAKCSDSKTVCCVR